jgi:hypothetical protein
MFKCEEKWEGIVRTSESEAAVSRGTGRTSIITILIV